jgi:hypothetical protein
MEETDFSVDSPILYVCVASSKSEHIIGPICNIHQ